MRPAATALLGGALVAAGVLFGLPSLHVPGVALAMLAAVAASWTVLAGRRATVEVQLDRTVIEEGESVGTTVAIRLPRWAPPAELGGPALGGPTAVSSGPSEFRLNARQGRRGRRVVGPARLALRDPLGLGERLVEGAAAEVLVVPRVEAVRSQLPEGGEGGERAWPSGGDGPQLELDSLRPSRPGAPATRIHWPTVARSGELFERRLIPDADSQPIVVLDAAAPAGDDDLDSAVRAAASLCVALARAGGSRLLLPDERRAVSVGPDLRSWPALHARLALVAPAAAPPQLVITGPSAAVFWVTAGTSKPPRELIRARGERWFVTPLPADDAPDLRVAGCTGRRLRHASARAA